MLKHYKLYKTHYSRNSDSYNQIKWFDNKGEASYQIF